MNPRTLSAIRSVPPLFGLSLLTMPAAAAFIVNADGTVTDTVTGLLWDRCSLWQTGNDCSGGSTNTFTWANALGVAVIANGMNSGAGYKGYTDWRLPNKNELESLVDRSRIDPAIDFATFPNTLLNYYWTSTHYIQSTPWAWFVHFSHGQTYGNLKDNVYYVRLVRSGQSFDALTDVNINADIATATVTNPDYSQYVPGGGQTPYTYGKYSFTLNTCQKNPPPLYNGKTILAFLNPWSATTAMTDRNAGQFKVNAVVNRRVASPAAVGSVVPFCTAYTGDTCITPLATWTVNNPQCHGQKYIIGVNTKRFSFYIDFYSALSLAP
jgi:hypothetical protein